MRKNGYPRLISAVCVIPCVLLCLVLSSAKTLFAEDRPIPDKTPDPSRTENFRSKRYGVFFHYLNGLQNGKESLNSFGKETSWDDCVNEFDVELFADQIALTGAGYVFFTMMQQSRFLCAPNSTFDEMTGYQPGEACSKRDLIAEIADALRKRGIDLYLYWTGDGPSKDPRASEALKAAFPVTAEYMRNWSKVVAEYGQRYQEKVKGWWIDGCYSSIGHTEETLGILAEGLRAGNPDRILAFNPGVDPEVMAYSVHDDFTAGEQNSFTSVPNNGRFLGGAQWHILAYLGNWWAAPGVNMTKSELAQYVWTVNRLGGVVTIDLMLYRDGSLDRSQLETVRELRARLQALDTAAVQYLPGENLASGGVPFLRSNDLLKTLPSSCYDQHEAKLGIDGDLSTSAVGANDWAWSYLVYLKKRVAAKQVTVHFDPNGWASDFKIFIKPIDADWQSIGRFDNAEGKTEFTVDFPPNELDAVRVTSYKPDGPDQPGSQMAITELEVF